jgi:2'-5' RNA ligase
VNTTQPEKDPWLGGEPQVGDDAPASAGEDEDADEELTDRALTKEREPGSAPETWRLFVAVSLPLAVRQSMAELGARLDERLRERVRWTPADNIHVTLQFLGDTDPGEVPRLVEYLSETAGNSSPMTIAAGKTGAFPLFRNPKILWIGFDGEIKRLEQLQGRVEGSLARLDFEAERRKFTVHATVGRTLRGLNSTQAADLGFAWKRMVGPRNYEKFSVESFKLYRSHLKSGGPVYEVVHEFRLGG